MSKLNYIFTPELFVLSIVIMCLFIFKIMSIYDPNTLIVRTIVGMVFLMLTTLYIITREESI